jgi:hypothetical protein
VCQFGPMEMRVVIGGAARCMPPLPCPVKSRRITVIPLASILNRIAAVARDINLTRKAVLRFHYALLPNTPPATVPGGRRGHSIMAMSIGEILRGDDVQTQRMITS